MREQEFQWLRQNEAGTHTSKRFPQQIRVCFTISLDFTAFAESVGMVKLNGNQLGPSREHPCADIHFLFKNDWCCNRELYNGTHIELKGNKKQLLMSRVRNNNNNSMFSR
jgi:hypothetical protein